MRTFLHSNEIFGALFFMPRDRTLRKLYAIYTLKYVHMCVYTRNKYTHSAAALRRAVDYRGGEGGQSVCEEYYF